MTSFEVIGVPSSNFDAFFVYCARLTSRLAILIPLLTAGGLLLLRQVEVARLAKHALPKDEIVPPFQLIEQNRQAFGSQQLLGKIWIADSSTAPVRVRARD